MSLKQHNKNTRSRIIGMAIALLVIAVAMAALNREYSPIAPAEKAHGSLVGYFGSKSASSMNVVLISLDTLRADHLGCYGYTRPTSPNIDRLAAESMLFERAYATAPATAESHMSMFTGLPPSVHKVWTIVKNGQMRVLDRRIATLPEILKKYGYRTAGFHGGGHVASHLGFGRGFDEYEMTGIETADQWVKENADGGKFFLFFHTYRVHDPYTASAPYDTMYDPGYQGGIEHREEALRANEGDSINLDYWNRVDKEDPADIRHLIALYDGALTELDADLGRFLKTIEEHAPNTLIILLSDHGELFGEYGEFRHGYLYPEVLHVPLIIHHPDLNQGVKTNDQVSLISLTPAILNMLGLPDSPQLRHYRRRIPRRSGEELIFASLPVTKNFSVISEDGQLQWRSPLTRYFRWTGAFADGRPKAGLDPTGPCEGSAEEVSLRKSEERLLEKALTASQQWNALAATAYNQAESREKMTPEMLERLKSLGYIR